MESLKQALKEEQGFGPHGVYRRISFDLPSLNYAPETTDNNQKPSFELSSLNYGPENTDNNQKTSAFELSSLNYTSENTPVKNENTSSSFELPSLNASVNTAGTKGKPSGEEIGQENLKHSLQEIISEIEQVASHDEQLLDDESRSANKTESLETRSDFGDSISNISMPGELKYDFLRRESHGKLNEGTKKGFSEQLNDYWITPEPGQESKPLVSDYKPTPDLLDFYRKKPPVVQTQTYVPQAKVNSTVQESKENEVMAPVELQDTDDRDPVVKGEEVLGEINSLIVHLEEITKRPRSLPPDINIFHLWKSLQIANELNQQLKDEITVDNAPFPNKAEMDKLEEKSGKLPPKPIDLDKLFTPAPDSDDLIIKDRKLYTSSSFYSPNHPTLEDQVNLARSISKSLTDISNHESKGQSMYVNRKKRSVKWVHEGEGKNPNLPISNNNEGTSPNKQLLKLVTDPRGQVQDIRVLKKQGYSPEPCLSPEICFDLVRDLNAPKGKGAELFAKRRKKSEKWIVEEKHVKTNPSSGFGGVPPPSPPAHLSNKLPPPPPSFLTGNTKRVEQVQKMNEVQERLSQPRVRLIKSPWEAALQTGSVETAFVDVEPRGFVVAPTPSTFEHIQRGSSNAPAPPPRQYRPISIDFSNLSNYNTAPRGWGRNMHVYKPVHLDMKPPRVSVTPTFTDF
uniref:Uncharacterized protein n=1 Tax=Cacopsylla melanoneura TaxID=428564 RepID=A0A8D8XZB3_9HEMI